MKLTDKKETKATNSQTIELTPVFSLNHAKNFRKDYRNVLVLPKLTFPEEKVLRLEISENQISGCIIVLTIEYEDILNADDFDSDILKNTPYYIITSNTLTDHEEDTFHIVVHGRFNGNVRARRQTDGECRLPVPVHVERHHRL